QPGRVGAHESGDRGPGLLVERGRLDREDVRAAVHVGVVAVVVLAHRLDDLPRLLRGGGAVEEHQGTAVDLALQHGEVGTDRGGVECHARWYQRGRPSPRPAGTGREPTACLRGRRSRLCPARWPPRTPGNGVVNAWR